MKKEWDLNKPAFDLLLSWLDADRDRAGSKYETIRYRLIKIFTCRGCSEAEDLADETINRVAAKLGGIASTYSGDPARYFYGVAQKVHLEYLRKRRVPKPPPPPGIPAEIEEEYICLEHCMEKLPPDQRRLVLEYYQEERQAKINHRKRLADQLGIAVNALRIRAYRIRLLLQECVKQCMGRRPAP